ncbi:MAG: PLP-dependent aminotransferase family protein [bacterium]|nr:PLP-dependent aminotransferase family protein [bacterium]
MQQSRFRYRAVARKIADHIHTGRLAPGTRLPSVRRLSRQEDASITTILHAYELLEREGVVEARPQSGYFVRADPDRMPPEPKESQPPLRPAYVEIADTVSDLLKITRQGDYVPFAAAIPASELLPVRQLQRIMAAISRRTDDAGIHYDLPPGNPELRSQLSRRSIDWGCRLGPDDFIITTGCMEALNLGLRSVARPGAVIAIESPAYYGILMTIAGLGMQALELPTHPSLGVRPADLERILKRRKIDACLLAPNFNNPLGSLMPDESKAELVELLARHEVPLIEDDIYGDLHLGETRPRTAKSFDRKGLVLLCSSFSKTVAPGYRVGYIAPGRYFEKVEQIKFMNTVATNAPCQIALAEFLRAGQYERHLSRMRESLSDQIQSAAAIIRDTFPAGTRVSRPQGGFVLWVELPPGTDSHHLYNRALENRINLMPGLAFSNSDRFRSCIRISCGHAWNDARRAALAKVGGIAAELAPKNSAGKKLAKKKS